MNVSSVAVAADGRFAVYEAQVDGEFRSSCAGSTRSSRSRSPAPRAPEARSSRRMARGSDSFATPSFSRCRPPAATRSRCATCKEVPAQPGTAREGSLFESLAVGAVGRLRRRRTPAVLTTPDRNKQEIGHWWPAALPDGRVLFTIVRASTGLNDARIALLDPARHVPGPVSRREGDMAFLRTHRVLPDGSVPRRAVRPLFENHRRTVSRARGCSGARSCRRLGAAGLGRPGWSARVSPGSLRPTKPAHLDRRAGHVHAARVCCAAVHRCEAVARRPSRRDGEPRGRTPPDPPARSGTRHGGDAEDRRHELEPESGCPTAGCRTRACARGTSTCT